MITSQKITRLRSDLLNSINNARNKSSLIKEIDHLKKEISEKYEFEKSIVGTSPAIRRTFAFVGKGSANQYFS